MGCICSTSTEVLDVRLGQEDGEQDETGSKGDGRGDSAVSKGTTDSGVVMENTEIPVLPGAVPRKLPPLTCVRESEADTIAQDGLRQNSSEILEELLNQGIIPMGQSREKGSGAGEVYSIMVDDTEGVRQRPPARLESLKANKMQNLPTREEIDEQIRLAEERRMLREDELKTCLRSKSASVRSPAPTSNMEEVGDEAFTPVEPLQHPHTPDPLDPSPHSQIEEAEGGEQVREAGGYGRECRGEMSSTNGGEGREEGAERGSEDGDREEEEEEEEELTQVQEPKTDQLLAALDELENDSSFQHEEDKEKIF